MSRKEYNNKCFLPNWLEVDLAEVSDHQLNKEERLESKRRKDLNTLLKELDEIKQNIEKAAEKQHRLKACGRKVQIRGISSYEMLVARILF